MKTIVIKILVSAIALCFAIPAFSNGDPAACPGAGHSNRSFTRRDLRNRNDYFYGRHAKGHVKHAKGSRSYYH